MNALLLVVSCLALVLGMICEHYWTQWYCRTTYRMKWPERLRWATALLNAIEIVAGIASAVFLGFFIFWDGGTITIATWQLVLLIFLVLGTLGIIGIGFSNISSTRYILTNPDVKREIERNKIRLERLQPKTQ